MSKYGHVMPTAIIAIVLAGAAQVSAGPQEQGTSPNTGFIKQAQAPQAPAAAPSGPQRVETTVYDSWTVTCQDTVGGATKKKCVASLRVQNNQRGLVLNWQIGLNQEGRLVTAIHAPPGLSIKKDDKTIGGPLLIPNGVELKFGNGPARRLSYVSCGPRQCLAEAPVDDAFMREAMASGKATITIHTSGGSIPFDLTIKGIDKAISLTRT